MRKKIVLLVIILTAINFTPVMADNKLATVYQPLTCERKVVEVGDVNAFVGGFRLETKTDRCQTEMGANIPVTATDWALATAHNSSVTTINLEDFNDIRGNAVASTSFPTKIYLVIEPENTANTEIVYCPLSGIDETNTQFVGCTRGLAFYGSSISSVTANQKSHPSGASVIMTNVGQFYAEFVDLDSSQTITGLKTFASSSYPRLDSYLQPSSDYEFAPKKYVDDTANQGAATGTESTAGIWKGATQSQMEASTAADGYNLLLQSKYASSTGGLSTTTIPVTDSTGKLNQNFLDLTENFTFTGSTTLASTTFNVFPTTPNSFPTASTSVSNKGYIDTTATTAYYASTTSKNLEDSTGSTTVITHSLGKAPKKITFHYYTAGTAQDSYSYGFYTTGSQWVDAGVMRGASSVNVEGIGSVIVLANLEHDKYQTGSVTAVTDTTVTITWTKTSTPTGTLNFYFIMEG